VIYIQSLNLKFVENVNFKKLSVDIYPRCLSMSNMEAAKAIHDFVALELQIFNDAISAFDNIERGTLSINLKPITTMLNTINLKLDEIPHKLARKFAKEAKFLHDVLNDYYYIVRETPELKGKSELLAEIRRLLEKCREILGKFHAMFGYIPPNRYIGNWYIDQRRTYRFLPPYDEKYWEKYYPDRRSKVDYYDAVVYSKYDADETRAFVPLSFMGSDEEYREYMIYLTYEDIQKMKSARAKTPLELSQEHEKARMVADGIIKSARRMFQQ
jgi:hypothetical protein